MQRSAELFEPLPGRTERSTIYSDGGLIYSTQALIFLGTFSRRPILIRPSSRLCDKLRFFGGTLRFFTPFQPIIFRIRTNIVPFQPSAQTVMGIDIFSYTSAISLLVLPTRMLISSTLGSIYFGGYVFYEYAGFVFAPEKGGVADSIC